jgi:predicted ATP-grasp superfamily ATP-dependent carboligase
MKQDSSSRPTIPAVVVGMCSHGLAIARSLGRRGIPVFALESNPALPAIRTRYAEVSPAANVNSAALIADLVRFRDRFAEDPVLFLTNDNMVRSVAEGFDEIRARYRLHWSDPAVVRRLLDKQHIEAIARSTGLGYPRSWLVSGLADLDHVRNEVRFPMALKPTKPLSGFKALKVHDEGELVRNLKRYERTADHFLLQEWVTGMEPSIYFANFYFDGEHRPIAKFVGRKIRSYPRNLGGACSAEPADRQDIADEALRFFGGAPVRGPASLEIKEDDSGRRFVIEPTIGRFDFYIQCCIANGVDFPYISYAYQTQAALPPPMGQPPGPGRMWVDFENDFPSLVGSMGSPGWGREVWQFLVRRKVFAFWAWDDPKPSAFEWPKSFLRYAERAIQRVARLMPHGSREPSG